jgi:Biopolymer transport proteins
MSHVTKEIEKGNIKKALEISKNTNTPFSSVVTTGLSLHGHNEVVISNAMEREITVETTKLERYTTVVGTIGSTAVYIGLFGTVLGIIRAFKDISVSGTGGINVVISGISEALACTATGLCVAVPAVIAYNYFIKKIDNFISDMELCASEIMDLITIKQNEAKRQKTKINFRNKHNAFYRRYTSTTHYFYDHDAVNPAVEHQG